MKKLLFLLLILNSISASTQTIKETAQAFWEANYSGNNPIIVEKGEQLINLIEKNNLKIVKIDKNKSLFNYEKKILIKESMIGHFVGEFAFTRRLGLLIHEKKNKNS